MRKPDNPETIKTLHFLRSRARELDAHVWRALAKKLEKSKHIRCVVNISRINRHSVEGEIVTVPGKVLGMGTLDHKVSVAAFRFSKKARSKIEEVGGKCLTFSDLIKNNPKGKNLRFVG